MSIKCIAIDLDSTTLDANGKLSLANKAAIEAAIAQGIHVVIASGRTFSALAEDVVAIRGIEYAVTSNGAAVYYLPTGQRLRHFNLTEGSVMKIMDAIKHEDIFYEAFIDGVAYGGREYIDNLIKLGAPGYALDYIKSTRKPCDDIVSFIYDNRTRLESLAVIVKNAESKNRIYEILKNTTSEIYMTSSIRQLIEISYKDAGKKSGIEYVIGLLGLGSHEVAAFGDADNDVDMLEFVGTGIAMENGSPRSKKAADYITRHHNDDGLAHGFRDILKLIF